MSIRLVNYDCNITEIPPGEYKAHVEGVWGPSEVEQIGTVHIAVDAGYANYRDIFKEEKKVKKINTVRVVGVTFNANTHNGNDTRMFRYLCPYEVKAGDIVIADTCYGPSLAKVAQVECYDATMSCRYNGLKTVIHAPLNIEMMKCASACAAQDMIKKCENDSCYKKLNDLQIRREGILHAKDEVLEDLHKANTEIAALESYMRRAGLL
jgi:hypothetical protein